MILHSFCTSVWSCPNKRRTYTKTISFNVRKDLLETELGQVFDTWSEVEYTGYKSITKEIDYISLLRQKINNLYTRYFDKEVILQTDYMDLLKTPKRLYLCFLNGTEMSAQEATEIIDEKIAASNILKEKYQKQKMILSWESYKIIVEDFLKTIFKNCTLIDEYSGSTQSSPFYDFICEDNFYIKYFFRSLEGYIKNYQKEYYNTRRGRNISYIRCEVCGRLVQKTNNRMKYCKECYLLLNKADARNRMKKLREKTKNQNVTL